MAKSKLIGVVLATAAAGFLSAPIVHADDAAGMVKCVGGNSCKGQSQGAGAESACKGQNSCKGKGWVAMSAADCSSHGGTAEAMDEKK